MWTREHRTIHRQSGERLPSDLTDAQWAHLEPLIPPADPGGRPRKTDMRAAMNAIFYLLRTGCPWRYLPRGPFPPRSTGGHWRDQDFAPNLVARRGTRPVCGMMMGIFTGYPHTRNSSRKKARGDELYWR